VLYSLFYFEESKKERSTVNSEMAQTAKRQKVTGTVIGRLAREGVGCGILRKTCSARSRQAPKQDRIAKYHPTAQTPLTILQRITLTGWMESPFSVNPARTCATTDRPEKERRKTAVSSPKSPGKAEACKQPLVTSKIPRDSLALSPNFVAIGSSQAVSPEKRIIKEHKTSIPSALSMTD